MLAKLATLLIPIALLILFAWLMRRAWGSRNRALKWIGGILAGVLTFLFALVTIVAAIGFFKLYAPATNPVSNVKVASSADQIARGHRLAHFCEGCHSPNGVLPLAGGPANFAQIPGGPSFGALYAPNLTPAGEIKDWTDGEIIRAIREGVHKSGRPLLIMPSGSFHNMSDEDVQSVLAYLRSQQPTPRSPEFDRPENGMNVLGAIFVGSGLFSTSVQAPIAQPVVAPSKSTTPDYGKYLVSIAGCRECHGPNLTGGSGGPGASAPNLTVIVPKWNEGDFIKTIRTGIDPTGHALNPDAMPWKSFDQAFDDTDLRAIYAYLHGLTPLAWSK